MQFNKNVDIIKLIQFKLYKKMQSELKVFQLALKINKSHLLEYIPYNDRDNYYLINILFI